MHISIEIDVYFKDDMSFVLSVLEAKIIQKSYLLNLCGKVIMKRNFL